MRRILVRAIMMIAALAIVPSAQAAFTVTLSTLGVGGVAGAPIVLTAFGGSTSGVFQNYSYSIVATGNAPSGLNPGNLQSITTSLVALASGLPDLQIVTFSDGYAIGNPPGTTGSAFLTTNFGSSALPTGTATAFSTISPGGSTTPITINAFAPGGGGGSPAGNSATYSTTTAFSLANTLTVSGLAPNAAVPASFTLTTTANFTPRMNAVPAPSALLLIGLGAPALGLVRRWTRKANVEPALA